MNDHNKLFGYARISTHEQVFDLQVDALLKAGVLKHNIYKDKVSGTKKDRPGFDKMMEKVISGDTIIVWRLDRLGRNLSHLVSLMDLFKEKNINFKSLCNLGLDTTSANGLLMFNIFASMAQFELQLTQERIQAGLAAARARGRMGGRKPVKPDSPKVLAAKAMHKDKSITITEICASLGISRACFYNYLKLGE